VLAAQLEATKTDKSKNGEAMSAAVAAERAHCSLSPTAPGQQRKLWWGSPAAANPSIEALELVL
jgi:hypothetical protein